MANKTNHIRTGKKVPCKICGEMVYRKGYLLKKFDKFYCSKECKGKDTYISQKGIPRPWLEGENNPAWKGDDVGYFALHEWVKRTLGTPQKCEHCETVSAKRFEWANISRKYKRDVKDWKRLCSKCHAKYDERGKKMKKTRKERFWSTNNRKMAPSLVE